MSEAAFIADSLKHIEAHLDDPTEKRRKCLTSYVSWTPEKVDLEKNVRGHLLTRVPLGYEAPEPEVRCMLKFDWLQAAGKEDGYSNGRAILNLAQPYSQWSIKIVFGDDDE